MVAEPAPPEPLGRSSTKLYQEFCAACHGENLAGGKAPSLISAESKHGRDDETLRRIIREGVKGTEMPPFSAVFSEAETQGLITYIRERITETADPKLHASNQLPEEIQTSALHRYRFESIAEGLDVPWSFVFLPDGRMLVTEREGRLRVIANGQLLPDLIEGVPEVVPHDEGGLMALELDPKYAENGWIYFSFSDPGETPAITSATAMTKVMRARLKENRLVDHETIFSIPREQYQKGFVGYGCRLLFVGEHLYFTIGDRWVPADAQDLTKPNGKVHRIFPDGKIPDDNPFAAQPGAFGSIWSFGHRNPQGLAVDPRNGALWSTEHGPRGGDELNLIQRGANYGWPLVTFGMNYDGTPISTRTEQAGLISPVINWTPSIAASPLLVYTGDKFPRWKNQLFLGSLGQQKFIRYEINDLNEIVQEEELFKGFGRVRDIKTGPDGFLYLSLELVGTPGRIVRLVPAP